MKEALKPKIKWRKFDKLPWWKRILTGFEAEYEMAIKNRDGTITIEWGHCGKVDVPYGIYVDMEGNEVKP